MLLEHLRLRRDLLDVLLQMYQIQGDQGHQDALDTLLRMGDSQEGQ